MASEHHFTLIGAKGGPPNGWKVAIVLEELGLDYGNIYYDLATNVQKTEEFTKYNPNGRIPALIDHKNGDFVIWESDAMITYLLEKYDTEHKISFEKFEDRMLQTQWLYFQAAGQAPWFGQAAFFKFFSPEKIPIAIERYEKEIVRVLGVLDGVLAKKRWLVGDKYSAADISFVTWNHAAFARIMKDHPSFNVEKDFPNVYRLGASFASYDSSYFAAGVAGGTVVLLGGYRLIAPKGYGWYHLSGAKKAVDSYNTATQYYEQTKHAFTDNAPKNPNEALNQLRTFAQSYLLIIPGASPHVDAAFDTIDELRDEHGTEVDRIVGGGYEEVRIIVRDAEAMDMATAARVLNVLRRRSAELEELGRRAGSGAFESLARKYPQVSETLGVGYEEFKKLAEVKGPDARKVFDDSGKQIREIFRKGFSQDSVSQARELIQSKTNEVRRIAQASSQAAWDKSVREASPYLNKLPEIRQILSDNASDFVSVSAANLNEATSSTEELFSRIKDAARTDVVKNEKKMGELRDYVLQKEWIRSMPGGDEALQRLPDMQVLVQVSRDRTDEADALKKETYEEILRVLEEKGKKAKEFCEQRKG
ncbi:hypothetical protein GSI_03884 [Ganoderma sinense ZZ0214-1]|uniref:Uncharacterized protein n=1 Tax=Ganoderma sinense ZZ0214-1 TaxID=1077348 RepID=A0A2G8SK95_9APHY|nr:hypothetical protein GSI_03884 [Ganoderma sinense ZZ0214-1]